MMSKAEHLEWYQTSFRLATFNHYFYISYSNIPTRNIIFSPS